MTRVRVLVVDDAFFMRAMVKEIFGVSPFVVAGEAEDGEEGVRRYRELRPDLTTLDIVMPKMDGLSALREIMQFDPQARVVMCSALGQEPLITEAISLGARDFIVKPFRPGRVLKVAQTALGLGERGRFPGGMGSPLEAR
jgi:two-component system, chemotaxis family, chemotaxis protein CheY